MVVVPIDRRGRVVNTGERRNSGNTRQQQDPERQSRTATDWTRKAHFEDLVACHNFGEEVTQFHNSLDAAKIGLAAG